MKKIILIIIIFVTGICVAAYPFVSNYLNNKNNAQLINAYNKDIEDMDEDGLEAELQRAAEYNQSLLGAPIRDPFTLGPNVVIGSEYYELLNVGGTMGYIEIPKISVRLPVFHGTGEKALKRGIGHLEGTSLPIGGMGMHSVLTGHTGSSNAKLFTDLTALETGDLFYIHVLNEILAYKVDDIRVILPEKTTDLVPDPEKDYCTLLTCTPYGVNSHRLLVRGIRTEYNSNEQNKIGKVRTTSDADMMVLLAAIITSAVMLILIILAIIRKRKVSKDREGSL